MKKALKPNNGQHVVEFDEKPKQDGSILLPDRAGTRPQTGTVLAASDGYYTVKGYHVPSIIKTGQRVMVAKHGGAKTDKPNVFVVKEQDILAVFE